MRSVFIVFVLVVLSSLVWQLQAQAHEEHGAAVFEVGDTSEMFVIEEGESRGEIAKRLKEEGYVDSTAGFLMWQFFAHRGREIKPGGYVLESDARFSELVDELKNPEAVWVVLQPGLARGELAEVLGEALGWSDQERQRFITTSASIWWDHFSESLVPILAERFGWGALEQELFVISASRYSREEYDLTHSLYEPGEYLFSKENSLAQIAAQFVGTFQKANQPYDDTSLENLIDTQAAENIAKLVADGVEDVPDLMPLPARDIDLVEQGNRALLVFSTTYGNYGEGPFELRADEATRSRQGDFEREVFQRIYRPDGTFREHSIGTFLWHQEHQHYHYADFVEYRLASVDASGEGVHKSVKRTFCIRDVETIETHVLGSTEPTYEICGRERQGISVGWGDTYFFTYADQNIDVTGLPTGIYRLSFIVNPARRFEELSLENNTSSVLLELDAEKGSVTVLEETSPATTQDL